MLLGPDGLPVPMFSAFAHSLRNNAKNTLDSYCRHLAEFLDYLIEISTLYEGPMSKLQLSEAIEAYGDYLVLGENARQSIARAVASRLPSCMNSPASLFPKKAAIRRFLRFLQAVRREMEELGRLDPHHFSTRSPHLLAGLGERREINAFEIRAMQANSMFAGVLAGGPKFIDCVVMNGGGEEIPYERNREFPHDKVMDLIRAMPSYRDKALYSLLAASGARTHEALQLLWDDIDVAAGAVTFVNPRVRIGHASYQSLSVEERARLSWKGRDAPVTLLLEPFASAFFQSLQAYLNYEYIAHGKHDFVFQYLTGERRGQPYYLSAASTRVDLFHRICNHIGVNLPQGTANHSLRHMYANHLLNDYHWAEEKFGLPLAEVQQLMGHAVMKSTRKYARHDEERLKKKIQFANEQVYGHKAP